MYNKFVAAINRMITCIHDGLSPSREHTIPFVNFVCKGTHFSEIPTIVYTGLVKDGQKQWNRFVFERHSLRHHTIVSFS